MPQGRTIDLRVAVVPATAAVPDPDPLFAVAGGPGDASSQFFAWLPDVYAGVHASRDIVLVDQRGTGESNPFVVPAKPPVGGLSSVEAVAQIEGWVTSSLAAFRGDPRLYTTTLAADDLDAVRDALGYDRINLYGTSYGGTVVQYYLRQHPDRVRVAILDGASPIDIPVRERITQNSQRAFDLLLRRCAGDEACDRAFPNLATEWAEVRKGLESGGITITNPDTGEQRIVELRAVAPSMHSALLTGATAGRLPLAIHLFATGHWDQLGGLIPEASIAGPSLLMANEILCSEAWARFDPAEVARNGEGSYALAWQIALATDEAPVCAELPAGRVPEQDGSPVISSLPILWLTGDGDPQDPPENLANVAAQEPNARVLVMPANEHVVGHLGCGPNIIAAFLEAGASHKLDAGCFADAVAPQWMLRMP